jgi:hypothetical protein
MTGLRVPRYFAVPAAVFIAATALAQTPPVFDVAEPAANATNRQASSFRVQSESFWYVRLGYGSILGEKPRGGPTLGLGYRVELDSLGIDVSFLNVQLTPRSTSSGGTVGSLLKLEALHFMKPAANASAYAGGGISYGATDLGSRNRLSGGWHGTGLQGEVTVGYEFLRDSPLRVFVQADATFPFYRARWETNGWSTIPAIPSGPRYAPVVALSLGVGWQRGRL